MTLTDKEKLEAIAKIINEISTPDYYILQQLEEIKKILER